MKTQTGGGRGGMAFDRLIRFSGKPGSGKTGVYCICTYNINVHFALVHDKHMQIITGGLYIYMYVYNMYLNSAFEH